MTITMYGIRNCDTIKEGADWLENKGVAYTLSRLQDSGH